MNLKTILWWKKESVSIYITSISIFSNLNCEFMWMLETHRSIIKVSVKGSGHAKFFEKVLKKQVVLLF